MEQLHLDDMELPWFRTLHSTAWKLLEMDGDRLMNAAWWKRFCKEQGYDLRWDDNRHLVDSDELKLPSRRTKDDDLRFVWEWGRYRNMSPRDSWSRCHVNVNIQQLALFIERVHNFKKEYDLMDFTDLLEQGISEGGHPPVEVAFIDEAQDLTPLQISAAEAWFSHCERVYIGGDEDQAIFTWNGASPDWMIRLKDECDSVEILDQSYRLPENIMMLGDEIIRQNRRRVEKKYKSIKPGGRIEQCESDDALQVIKEEVEKGKSVLVLVRNRIFLRDWHRALKDLYIPYSVHGLDVRSPLENENLRRAVLCAEHIRKGRKVTQQAMISLMDYIPSNIKLFPRGTKKKVKEHDKNVDREYLIKVLGMGKLIERIDAMGAASALYKEKKENLEYLQAFLNKSGELPYEEKVKVMTIHAAKGKEAEVVIIDQDMAKASYESVVKFEESENRVAYVAVTRAKERIVFVRPKTNRHYPYMDFVRIVARKLRSRNG
jgi:DNA helicase-2/ATP-dependent DNA helicase PcrA